MTDRKGISRRSFLRAASAGLAAAASGQNNQRRPNVVILLADDLGWSDVGFHGSEIRTPNLDRLSKQSLELEQFYSYPVCSPTRAGLMTGRHPIRYGLSYSVVRPWAPYGLPVEETTLAQIFHEAGYETSICGKWHLGHAHKRLLPQARGFDHFYGHVNGAIDYFEHQREGAIDWQRHGKSVREQGYTTDLLAQEASRRIEQRDQGRPFFLYVPWNAPHTPLQAPEELIASYQSIADPKRRIYAAMVESMDRGIGGILDALDRYNIRENTIVLFFSDNGGPTQNGATNGKLRAGKGTVFEGGTRVPALVSWPGVLQPGKTNQLACVLDILPTLIRAAGLQHTSKLPLDGQDLWENLRAGKTQTRPPIFLAAQPEHGRKQHALRDGDWKLVRTEPTLEQSAEVWLFNVKADPEEKLNRLAEQPEVASRLTAKMEEWIALHPPADIMVRGRPHPGWIPPDDWAQAAND